MLGETILNWKGSNKGPLSPLRKVVERTAAATRISQSTVKNVSREMDDAQETGSSQLVNSRKEKKCEKTSYRFRYIQPRSN